MTATSTPTPSVPDATAVTLPTAPALGAISSAVSEPITASMRDHYAALGLAFEHNDGQTDSQVHYLAHGHGYTVFLTGSDAVLALVEPRPPVPLHTLVEQQDAGTQPLTPTQETVLRLHFVGANAAATPRAEDPLSSTASYFVGKDPQSWHAGIALYQRVVYHNLYPGIDLAYHGARNLEYDWLLAPGADPSLIQFSLQGAQGLTLDAQDNLLVRTAVGVLGQTLPTAYQDVNGQRHHVSVRYTLDGAGHVGVALGAYDASKPLVIDPTLSYSTYLGGSGTDVGAGITTDNAGDAYVVGWTGSANFPVTGGVYGTILNGPTDVFIAKFDPNGALVWSTYLGGSGDDVQYDSQIAGIAVDGSGNVAVSGSTVSTDFPTTSNAVQRTFGGGNDAFVSEVNATGRTLLYSTYLGGGCNEYAPALVGDGSGKIYVTGSTCSSNFPTLHSLQAFNGGSDAFIVKIDPTATSSLVYSTFLGGTGQDGGYGIAVDKVGDAYVTGDTNASDFPVITSTAVQPTRASYCADGTCHDAFFSELNPAGTALLYSTYLGGTHDERALRLALDKNNNVYITGWTSSIDFPITAGAYRTGPQGGGDAFVAKLNPAASGAASLVYSTYLGGSGDDYGYGIAVDSTSDALVTGQTASSDLHPTPDALQGVYGGAIDAFVLRLNPAGSAPLYSTYLGGSGADYGYGVATDASGNAYVTGSTASTNFATAGAIQGANGGGTDAFVSKIAFVSSGNVPWHPHHNVHLSAGLDVSVDLADGHVDVMAADLSVPARGPALTLSHTWDSTLADHGSAYASNGWVSTLTPSLGGVLTQTMAYTDASGAVWLFPYKGSLTASAPYTAYQIPAGQPWRLVTSPITGSTLSNVLSGEVLAFNAQGRYSAETDAYSNTNTMGYDVSGLISVTNSGGRPLALSYTNGLLGDTQGPLWRSSGGSQGQHLTYGYTSNYLSALARGSGTSDAITEYFGYGVLPAGAAFSFMTAIQTPLNRQWMLGYDAGGRLTSITSPVSGTLGQAGYTPAYTTTMSYSPGQTVVVEGDGSPAPIAHTYTLDAQGEATQTQDGLGDTTSTTYDADHDPVSTTDANGKTTTNLYQYVGPTGSTGLVTQTVQPALTSYLAPGNPSAPVVTRYRYDPTRYDLVETDKPAGGIVLYGYNGAHSVLTTTELLNITTSGLPGCPTGGAAVRTAAATAANPSCPLTYHWRAHVDAYNGYGEHVSATDGRGVVVPDTTDTGGITPTAMVTDTQGLYTSHEVYNAQGDQTASGTPVLVTTLNGITTTASVTTTEGYDGDGNGVSTTTANGNTTTRAYDHLGRLVRTTLPSVTLYNNTTTAAVETMGYDGDGNVVSSTDGAGDLTTSSYDPLQRQVATTDPVSGTMAMTYTATELMATQDRVGNISHDAYDGAGRLILASDPLTGTVGYGYDAVGNTTAITSGDNTGHVTQLETRGYDAWNRAITDTVSGPGSPSLTTLTAYDLDGNVKQTEQPQGDTTYNAYDLADQLSEQFIYPHPVTTLGANDAAYSYDSYDRAGNVTLSIDADGRSTTTTLDGADRTVQEASRTADGATVITTTNSFDPNGAMVFWTRKTQSPGASVGTQTNSARFDAADRQISTTDNGLTTRYGYDAAGRLRTHTIVDGATTVTTTMDSEGRAVALSEGLGGAGPYVGRLGYNLNDLPITMTLPGGITEGQGYDASSRLVTTTLSGPASLPATTTLNSAYAYGYNAVNWTTRTTTLSGTDTLVHDAQRRLTSETGPQVVAKGGTYAWTYDQNGNLISQIGDDGYPVTYTYTQAITPNEVQSMVMGDGQPTAFYGYDVHGDTTAITDGAKLNTHLVYDSQARPVQIMTLDRGTPLTVTLTYNPSGQRASYHVVEPGQPTLDEQFTYRGDVLGQVRVTNDGILLYTDTYLYTEAGAPYELLRQQGGATNRYWYAVDGRGNVVALTDVTGKVVDRYAYDSWGELTSDDGVNESVPQQLRYAGYWYDEKVSWYWLRVRYYDPEIARFLAPDPSQQDGVRTYAYVNNDPIDATDPSGLHRYLIWAAAFIAPKTISYLGVNYAGDGRGFWNGMGVPPTNGDHPLQNSRGSSKAWNYVVIDDGLNRSRPTAQNRSGVTHSRSDAAFLIAKSGYANDPDLASVTYNKSNIGSTSVENIDVEINGASANPLIPAIAFAPPIRYRYSLQFQYLNGQPYLLSIWGQHTDFPSQELLVKCLDCGAGQILTDPQWHFTPKAGATPSDLYNTDYLYGPGQVQDIYLSGL